MTMVITALLAFPAFAETTGPPSNQMTAKEAVISAVTATVSDIDIFTKKMAPMITVLHPVPALDCIFPVITVLHQVPVIICIDRKKTPTIICEIMTKGERPVPVFIMTVSKKTPALVQYMAVPVIEEWIRKLAPIFIHPQEQEADGMIPVIFISC